MLEKELEKLGLSEKEAKVYLASLELGASPVQKISQKAKVNRATTYVVIEDLKAMGLMSTFEEGKKTFFVAEKPERLLVRLESEEVKLKEKIGLLQERLPELKSIFNAVIDKPKVRYFEGVEGLKTVQQDFIESLHPGDILYTFFPHDKGVEKLGFNVDRFWQKRVQKKITTEIIYSSPNGRQKDYEEELAAYGNEAKFIDYKEFPIKGGMNIYGNKIFMIDYQGKLGGIMIENQTLAEMMRLIFKLLWKNN